MRPTPDFTQLRLRTARLLLRPLTTADTDALYALHSDPLAMRYWIAAPWTQRAQAEASIARDADALPNGTHLRLGLELLSAEGQAGGSELIGHCSLFAFMPQCRRCELGYALRPAHWGRGYVQEAVGVLLDWAFPALDLHRVEADADPRNVASLRSLQRLGFTREGTLRERWIVEGEVSDTAAFGLLRREWRSPA